MTLAVRAFAALSLGIILSVSLAAAALGRASDTGSQTASTTHRPDGKIRFNEACWPADQYGDPAGCDSYLSAWKGDNVYNTTGQKQSDTETFFGTDIGGEWWVLDIAVQNDGSSSDRFRIHSVGSGPGFKYFHGTTNITSAVVAGTFRTSTLAPGESYFIKVRVYEFKVDVPTSRLITLTSVADSTKKDALKIVVKDGGGCGC